MLGTVYRPLSYLYHLAGRFLHGYPRDGAAPPAGPVRPFALGRAGPGERPVRAKSVGSSSIRRARTVSDALLDADGRLAVEGVLIVAEHGNYPRNDKGQILYPRYEIFEQVVETFRRVGRSVPVFVAKHLSYDLRQARRMVEWAEELGFPLMAGSTLADDLAAAGVGVAARFDGRRSARRRAMGRRRYSASMPSKRCNA